MNGVSQTQLMNENPCTTIHFVMAALFLSLIWGIIQFFLDLFPFFMIAIFKIFDLYS